MDNVPETITIDWGWVKEHLTARERLERIGELSTKREVLKNLADALDIAKSLAAPKASFAKKRILGFAADSIKLGDDKPGIQLFSKELSSHLKGATHIYAYLVTIGEGIENAASSGMGSGDHLLGYLLDRIGSFAAESMAKNAEDALRQRLAAEDSSVSMRFSPGYCDWGIEEQSKLARIINFSKIGVTLTDSFMMAPKKSISAVVGIGPKELFSKVKSPCSLCNMKSCDYRRSF